MTDERESLRRQLTNAEENLRLIRERKAEFVLGVEVPLQLVREERRLEARIGELRAALGLKTEEREGGAEETLAGADVVGVAPTREANPAKGDSTVVGRVLWPFIRYFWLALLALVGLTSGLIQIRQTDSWKPIVITLVALTGIYALIMIVRDRMIRQGRQRRDAEALHPTGERQPPRTAGRALFFSVNVVRYALILIFLAGMAGIWALSNASLDFLDELPVTAIAADSGNPGTLYAATWGGLHKTTNAGLSWDALANEGPLGFGNHISALTVDPNDSNTVYAGTTTIYRSRDAGHTWQDLSVPTKSDITQILVAADDSKKIYAVAFQDGILKSTDGGESWYAINKGIDDLWVKDLALDPNKTETLYAAADQIYVSTNGGAQWSKDPLGVDQRFVSVVAISPAASHDVIAGGCGSFLKPLWAGVVYRRDPVQREWQVLGAPDNCETEEFRARAVFGCIEDIVFDPEDSDRFFAATWENQLYKTLDGGRTWEGLEWTPEGDPFEAVLDPGNNDRLFVATTRGVWEVRSEDIVDFDRGIFPRYWAISRSNGLGTGVLEGALRSVDRYRRQYPTNFYLLCAAALGGLLLVVSVISVVIAITRKAWKRTRGRLTWKRAGQAAKGMRRRITTWRLALIQGIRRSVSAAIGALTAPTDGQVLIGSILLAAALLCMAMFLLRIPKVNLSISSVEQKRADIARAVDAYWVCNSGPRPTKNVVFDSLQQKAVAVLTPHWLLRCAAFSYPWGRTQGVYQIEQPSWVEAGKCEPVFVEYDARGGGWSWAGRVSYAEQSPKGAVIANPVQAALMIAAWGILVLYLVAGRRLSRDVQRVWAGKLGPVSRALAAARRQISTCPQGIIMVVVMVAALACSAPLLLGALPKLVISGPLCAQDYVQVTTSGAMAPFAVSNLGFVSAHNVFVSYTGIKYQFTSLTTGLDGQIQHGRDLERVGGVKTTWLDDLDPGQARMLFVPAYTTATGENPLFDCSLLDGQLKYDEQQAWPLIKNHPVLVGVSVLQWIVIMFAAWRILKGKRDPSSRYGRRLVWIAGMLLVVFALDMLALAILYLTA